VITAQDPPEAARSFFEALPSPAREIHVPGAAWLQLRFAEGGLREGVRLVVTSPDGQTQRFTAAELGRWGGLTAAFNGDRLTVRTEGGSGQAAELRITEMIVGLPGRTGPMTESTLPAPLRNFLGPRPERFRPPARTESPAGAQQESQCGPTDDRTASNNALVGRIVPVGCTGWLMDGDRVITAGHCLGAMDFLQFNVPRSLADGTIVNPGVRDQYRIDAASVVGRDTGTGDDWAVFRVLPNNVTNLLPAQAQGGTFQISRTDRPNTVRVTGYGTDNGADNQTQQTHTGAASYPAPDSEGRVRINHSADTTGGNSGGPIINEAMQGVAVGIHTNAGCMATGGQNAGTSFANNQLWNVLQGGEGPLNWQRAGNTAGFGQIADGRPFWTGNFDGQGGDDILFYFPGDQNWWLGRFDGNGALNWQRAGNTAGFGQVADGRPFWTGNFDGQGGDDILFYFPGDHNWWLGRVSTQ